MSRDETPMNTDEARSAFAGSKRPHVVMVTNHGMHDWKIEAGLPDTGGQNVYVNELSHALTRLGFKVTIYNRGGYDHPVSATPRRGTHYRDGSERIVYLEDREPRFIRKEEMAPQIAELGSDLARRLQEAEEPVALISHYWDGAAVAEEARTSLGLKAPHIWIPHSLGALKRQNTPQERWQELKVDERISYEREIVGSVDLIGATSEAMRESLRQEYGVAEALFLPPCVDQRRFNRDSARSDPSALGLLASATRLEEAEVARRRIITEVSRTDRTKRKDLLIEAYAAVAGRFTDTLLAITIDPGAGEIYEELTALIARLGLSRRVAVLGSIGEYLPSLYGMSSIYCTPSIMEGFGMSIQEAAACGVPAVASSRVPFAVEYLGGKTRQVEGKLEIGEAAIIVPPNALEATAQALSLLLEDEERRRRMAARAERITLPRFTWDAVTRSFLQEAGIAIPEGGSTDA